MKFRYIYLILIAISLYFTSCNDWLDIQPKSEVGSDDLFSTPEGYRNAINGIYLNIATEDLYAHNMTWGLMDVLGQYYKTNIKRFKEAKKFNYEYSEIQNMVDNIWSSSYNAVANCNNFLSNISDKDTTFFSKNERYMLEGEVLGLRAMLHFDMLRVFAPSPVKGDYLSIPYYKNYSSNPEPRLKTSEVINNILSDLLKSRELLSHADTSDQNMLDNFSTIAYRFGTRGRDKNFSHRGYRFNYFAATALLARVNLYAGNKKVAYDYANELIELIDSDFLRFTYKYEVSQFNKDSRNRKLSHDVLYATYNYEITDEYKRYVDEGYSYMALDNMDKLFETNSDDFRYKYLIIPNSYNRQISLKYTGSEDYQIQRDLCPLIPMIRLSEMFYIAGEYLIDNNKDEAIDLLNYLRLKRGNIDEISKNISKEEYMEELIKDARKEFIGEGQIFFMYKRLNHPIINGDQVIDTENINFTLPYPHSETNTGSINA